MSPSGELGPTQAADQSFCQRAWSRRKRLRGRNFRRLMLNMRLSGALQKCNDRCCHAHQDVEAMRHYG
jgi:hypothetical protein